MRVIIGLLVMSLLIGCATPAKVATHTEVVREARYSDSIMIVRAQYPDTDYWSYGTAFAADGHIFAALHVLRGTKNDTCELLLQGGELVKATGWRKMNGDVAIILTEKPLNIPYLKRATEIPEGEFEVTSCSNWYDHVIDNRCTVTCCSGVAQKIANPQDDKSIVAVFGEGGEWLFARFPCRAGMSGGPVLHKGLVVALISARSETHPSLCAVCIR